MTDKVIGQYLGDDVYARQERNGVMLSKVVGSQIAQQIVLEPEVFSALIKYVEQLPASRNPSTLERK